MNFRDAHDFDLPTEADFDMERIDAFLKREYGEREAKAQSDAAGAHKANGAENSRSE